MTTFRKNLELLGRFAKVAPFFAREAQVDTAFVPETDAEEWFASLELDGVNVIYCFGLGTGAYYYAARKWLRAEPSRYLVFLDDSLPILRRFLETEAATEILSDKRVRYRLIGEPNEGDQLLQIAIDTFAALNSTITANQRYLETRGDFFAKLERAVATMVDVASISAFHATNINETFYAVVYPAMRKLIGSYHGSALFGKFKGVPAIISGAGPSLNKQLPLLRELQDRALIFAGGSGFTALTRAGIEPHFGAGMSPAPDEIDRFWQARGYETPFFWKFRLHPEALDMIHGPRLYQSSDRNTGIISWIEEELGIPPAHTIYEGPSITFYLTCLVHLLGCDPIFYVGADLALTDEQAYAGNVNHDLDVDGEAITAIDIHGQEIRTYYKWVHERYALGEAVEARASTRYFNCTEGGLGIEGVTNLSLREAAEKYLTKSHDFRDFSRSQMVSVPLSVTPDALREVLSRLQDSLVRSIELIDQMVVALERVSGRVQEHVDHIVALIGQGPEGFREAGRLSPPWGAVEPWLADGEIALIQSDLEEEPAFTEILGPMAEARVSYHQRIYDEFVLGAGKREAFRAQRRLNIEQEHFLFLQQAARDNLELLKKEIA